MNNIQDTPEPNMITYISGKFTGREYVITEVNEVKKDKKVKKKGKIVEPIKVTIAFKSSDVPWFTSEKCALYGLDSKTFVPITVNGKVYKNANTLTAETCAISRAKLVADCKKILSAAHVNYTKQKQLAKIERAKNNKLPILNRGRRGGHGRRR